MAFLPALAAIASIVGTGVTVGETLANRPSSPKPAAAPAGPTPEQQAATKRDQTAAVTQQLPTLEGLTSGFANPGYYAQQGALAAGVAGDKGGASSASAAVERAFGLPPGTLSGVTGTPDKFKPVGTGSGNAGQFANDKIDLSNFVNGFIST